MLSVPSSLRHIFHVKWEVIEDLWAMRTRALARSAERYADGARHIDTVVFTQPFADRGVKRRELYQALRDGMVSLAESAEHDVKLITQLRRLYLALNLTASVDITGYTVGSN